MTDSQALKIVLLGDSGVGKSCTVSRFVNNTFLEGKAAKSTIGDSSGRVLKFQIWDTAGQERYRSLASMYYRNTVAAIVVYDITNYESYEGAKSWVEELRRNENSNSIVVLAGNKTDLPNRAVMTEEVRIYCQKENLIMCETSALHGNGIKEMFLEVANRIPKYDAANGQTPASIESEILDLELKLVKHKRGYSEPIPPWELREIHRKLDDLQSRRVSAPAARPIRLTFDTEGPQEKGGRSGSILETWGAKSGRCC